MFQLNTVKQEIHSLLRNVHRLRNANSITHRRRLQERVKAISPEGADWRGMGSERAIKVRKFLKDRLESIGWKVIGEGVDRQVWGKKDKPYVIKFGKHDAGRRANRAEWFLCNNIPDNLRQHFAEALFLTKKGEVLVQERVEVNENAMIHEDFQKFGVSIRDMHGYNRGFRKGAERTPVALDYGHSKVNFDEYERSIKKESSQEVREAYNKFWGSQPWSVRFTNWVREKMSRKAELLE